MGTPGTRTAPLDAPRADAAPAGPAAATRDPLAAKSARLRDAAAQPLDALLRALGTTRDGLDEVTAAARFDPKAPNEVAHERPPAWYARLAGAFANPFNAVLAALAAIELWESPHDLRGPVIICVMVAISVAIRFAQELRSGHAAERLRALVSTTATVLRPAPPSSSRARGAPARGEPPSAPARREIPVRALVPGDVVALAAGDMIPADVRLLTSKDLFVTQAVLTGESMPVEKAASAPPPDGATPVSELAETCLMGTTVVSGTATAVVVAIGHASYFGSITHGILGRRAMTSFDVGVGKVSWTMIRFMAVMAPVVLVINGFTKGDWRAAVMFALSVAVGLIPEMLPLVVTANLARGALDMSKKKVVVKRLNAIQNFGAMDVLCTDKTGTLTQDRVVLEQHVDVVGRDSREVLRLAYVNSWHQTGLRNLLDRVVLEKGDLELDAAKLRAARKVDEVPFDFTRKRMTVVVAEEGGAKNLVVCKGAVDEVLRACGRVRLGNEVGPITDVIRQHVGRITGEMNEDGLRVVAVAYKEDDAAKCVYAVADEEDMILAGYIGFLDPPRDTAREAIVDLARHGVAVKVLTGDGEAIARKVCRDVGLTATTTLLGARIDEMSDEELADAAADAVVFAKLNPLHKSRIVRALKARGHTVGFMGDGINDAPALREADIGISVDSAVDVAKESADIILLEKGLLALGQGVIEGRTTFGNTLKYIKMTASSNFGNVFSVLVASAFLPFLPMLPLQILIQNLLYDLSQLSIPWDRMDPEFLRAPRKWDAGGLMRFMLFIGPISSVFDVATYLVLWFAFGASSPATASFFQSGWFVEGLLSQTLIVHMIRTPKIPFVQSRAAPAVMMLTAAVMAVGVALPYSPIGAAVGLRPLPVAFFAWLVAILVLYSASTQAVKRWYVRRFGAWL